MKEKLRVLFLLIIPTFITIFALYKLCDKKPVITVVVELKDYSNINKDLKEIYVSVYITNAKGYEKNIKIPDLNIIDHIDTARSMKQSSQLMNNIRDTNAQYVKRIIFDMKGLTIAQLKDLFYQSYIIVELKCNPKNEMYIFNIGNEMKDYTDLRR